MTAWQRDPYKRPAPRRRPVARHGPAASWDVGTVDDAGRDSEPTGGAAMTVNDVFANARSRYGFLRPEEITVLAAHAATRLTPILVRFFLGELARAVGTRRLD